MVCRADGDRHIRDRGDRPQFGFISMFAVANSALINMLMASRLVYGMT
jgi:hypothetical protein